MNTAKAIGYMRFSSRGQIIGNSEARQEDGYASFVSRSKLVEGEIYFDKGESAYHGNHRSAEFGRLLADCQAKKFPTGSVIWFEDQDRFGRGKLFVVLSDWQAIIGNGYGIHIDSLGKTYDSDTPEMELMAVILKAILAHEESEKKSKRGKDNRKRIRETGLTKHGKRSRNCPFWVSVNEAGEYVLNDQAALVKEMFRLSALGNGAQEVSTMLDTPTRRIKVKGKVVDAQIDVLGVLRNDAAARNQSARTAGTVVFAIR